MGSPVMASQHQPNPRLFGDPDSRAQYGYRLITGAYTPGFSLSTQHSTPAASYLATGAHHYVVTRYDHRHTGARILNHAGGTCHNARHAGAKPQHRNH